jgi:hypothetical protein
MTEMAIAEGQMDDRIMNDEHAMDGRRDDQYRARAMMASLPMGDEDDADDDWWLPDANGVDDEIARREP